MAAVAPIDVPVRGKVYGRRQGLAPGALPNHVFHLGPRQAAQGEEGHVGAGRPEWLKLGPACQEGQ